MTYLPRNFLHLFTSSVVPNDDAALNDTFNSVVVDLV